MSFVPIVSVYFCKIQVDIFIWVISGSDGKKPLYHTVKIMRFSQTVNNSVSALFPFGKRHYSLVLPKRSILVISAVWNFQFNIAEFFRIYFRIQFYVFQICSPVSQKEIFILLVFIQYVMKLNLSI